MQYAEKRRTERKNQNTAKNFSLQNIGAAFMCVVDKNQYHYKT